MLRNTYFIWRNRLVVHLGIWNHSGLVYVKETTNKEVHVVKETRLQKPTKEELALYLIIQ